MNFKKCTRCGTFYISENDVCAKCSCKDGLEFSTFKTYIEENGVENSLDIIAGQTGISTKNLNRFIQANNLTTNSNDVNTTLFDGSIFE